MKGVSVKKCIITKSYGEWSSSTVVELLNRQGQTALVKHVATDKTFYIPVRFLTEKRHRS